LDKNRSEKRIRDFDVDLQTYFISSLPELEVGVRCKCGHQFKTSMHYDGILDCDERDVGLACLHVWSNDCDCLSCSEVLEIELMLWECPEGFIGCVDFDSNCEILNQKEIYDKIGYMPANESQLIQKWL